MAQIGKQQLFEDRLYALGLAGRTRAFDSLSLPALLHVTTPIQAWEKGGNLRLLCTNPVLLIPSSQPSERRV